MIFDPNLKTLIETFNVTRLESKAAYQCHKQTIETKTIFWYIPLIPFYEAIKKVRRVKRLFYPPMPKTFFLTEFYFSDNKCYKFQKYGRSSETKNSRDVSHNLQLFM